MARSKTGMRRVLLLALSVWATTILSVPLARAQTAVLDPQNLIADDIQAQAIDAYARQAARAPFKGDEIVVVDYRLPSTARRLYILNMRTGAVEAHYVAHGRGSDPQHSKMAVRFSNTESSGMSSLGAYRGGERYQSPAHGPALRLHGLDASNASAYERLIVFHTAPYFDPENGKFGRSLGCFVVTTRAMNRIYDVIANGGFVYAGAPRTAPQPDILMAAAAPPSTPDPAPVPAAPVIMASLTQPDIASDAPQHGRPKARAALVAAFVPPMPHPKPRLDAVAQSASVPVPQAKPDSLLAAALIATPPAVPDPAPAPQWAEIILPQIKPAAIAAVEATAQDGGALMALITMGGDAPLPQPKPVILNAAASEDMGQTVPLPLPKPATLSAHEVVETPVPQPKPDTLAWLNADSIRR